ncbi:MAG: class I SAM-dependent methyltransferase [Pseudomonadota bacterium]
MAQSVPGAKRHSIIPAFSERAFIGAADYYAKYRVPYPQDLLDCLLAHCRIERPSRLLDLACGTGQIALPMSRHFTEVWAQDLEPEMIQIGRRMAKDQGLTNLIWKRGRAEDLDAPARSFDLITVGSAFHRLHRRKVCNRAKLWLRPDGRLAVVGSNSVWTGVETWQAVARDVLEKWKVQDAKEQIRHKTQARETFEESLDQSGFHIIEARNFATERHWSLSDFIGYCFSLSGLSPIVLGSKAGDFERELRQKLTAHSPDCDFGENVQFHLLMCRAA